MRTECIKLLTIHMRSIINLNLYSAPRAMFNSEIYGSQRAQSTFYLATISTCWLNNAGSVLGLRVNVTKKKFF